MLDKIKRKLNKSEIEKLGVQDENGKRYNHRELLLVQPQTNTQPRQLEFIPNDQLPPTFQEFEQRKGIRKAIFDTESERSLWFKDSDGNIQKRYSLNTMFRGDDSRALYTKEHLKEWAKCRDDIITFCKYCSIMNIDHGRIVIPLRDYQVDLLRLWEGKQTEYNNHLTMLPRQIGKSSLAAIHLAHFLIFNDRPAAIVSFNATNANEIFDRVRDILLMLPDWLQPSPTKMTDGEMVFSHGSSIIARTCKKDSLRGGSFAKVFADEFAHYGTDIDDTWSKAIRPTLSSGKRSSVIICSTPKGDNKFKELWDQAKAGKIKFSTFEGDWRLVQDRMYSEETGKLDNGDYFYKNEINIIGRIAFEQEHCCSFLSSSQGLISPQYIEQAVITEALKHDVIMDDRTIEQFDRYERPEPEHRYCIGVDPSLNKGIDRTVFQVVDVSTSPIKLVASFSSPDLYPEREAELLAAIARHYNRAFVFIEINSPTGSKIIEHLRHKENYRNIYKNNLKSFDGIITDKHTKRAGAQALKYAIEENDLVINSQALLSELVRFCLDKTGLYSATDGHDDQVMALMMIFIGLQDTDFNHRWIHDQSHIDGEDEFLPLAFHTGNRGEFINPVHLQNQADRAYSGWGNSLQQINQFMGFR
ncbi:terminase large subunit domain-containing protein [Photobacterium damselae]|uniref:terminase large subunit domain-containing protein n=1 Tax=Photobacterium damselae TaxID=38293 RepID=UPI003D7C5CF4